MRLDYQQEAGLVSSLPLGLNVKSIGFTKSRLVGEIFTTCPPNRLTRGAYSLVRLDYQQEAGLVSSLPLGLNEIPIQRGLTTSSTAIFVPHGQSRSFR